MFYYNNYGFDTSKKYLILYRGNFSPCTRGHFSLLKKYIGLENVTYFISHLGSQRHGIPYHFSEKMWKIYLRELLTPEERKRVILRKMEASTDVLKYVEGYDVVLFVRGREEEGKAIKQKEKEREAKYKKLTRSLHEKGIVLDYLILDRLEANLSATKFTQALIANRNQPNYKKLLYYLPSRLPMPEVRYIVTKLLSYNLK